MQYLSESGLNTLWTKLKSTFQPKNGNLTSIAGQTATQGYLKKTAENFWVLDNTAFAPASSFYSHVDDLDNPHFVTKSHVGLSNVTNDAQVKRSEMGVASGVATLGTDGKVPASQLPSYVDDVLEGYYHSGKFYQESAHTHEMTGETGKIYVDLATSTTYRWSGTGYALISASIALGETSSTAYSGDKGKANADNITTLLSYFTSGVAKNAARLSNTSAIGSSTKPVYFNSSGVPVAISYSIARNVAANEDVTAYTAGSSISVASHVISVSMVAVGDPSSSGSALSFIDSIQQNSAGRITATKKAMREASASQSGIVSISAQTFKGDKTIQGFVSATGNIMSTGGGVSAAGICDLTLQTGSGSSISQLLSSWNDEGSDDMALSASLGRELKTTKADAASISSGTAGTSSATSGTTLEVPYLQLSSQGVVTGYGVHTHTISGLFTALSSNTTNAVSITVNGTTKNITAATLKTSLGLGSAAYQDSSAFLGASAQAADSAKLGGTEKSGLLTALSSGTTNAVSITVGGTTKNITVASMKNSLGLAALAYKSSLAFSDLTSKPTTISGYGITDCTLQNTLTNGVVTAFELTVGSSTVTVGEIPAAIINALSL